MRATLEVFQFVEFLHDLQVGLKCLESWGSNFLDGFIAGKEVKKLVDVSAKDVDTSKFVN